MIFIAGASGFVGGHLVDYLTGSGRKVRCLARSINSGSALSAKGVEVVRGDITAPETLAGVLSADDFVVHLVGIIEEKGKATFDAVHLKGTTNLVAEAKRAGVGHFFYQSALGADTASWSAYLRTKAQAEEIVRQSGLGYTIFRPSLIIGPWDGFTKKILEMLKFSPVLPIPGEGKARLQPVYVKDWLRCLERVMDSPADFAGTYDLGGPEHLTYRKIIETLSAAMGYAKPTVTVPMSFMRLGASFLEKVLPSPPVTTDQLRLLEQDNICDLNAIEKNFGFVPTGYEAALKEFISPFKKNS